MTNLKIIIMIFNFLRSITFLVLFSMFFVFSCGNVKKSDAEKEIDLVSKAALVRGAIVKEDSFLLGINSNGKLEAIKKIELKFENEGLIQKILVNDGHKVKKGQIIAYQNSKYILSEEKKNEEILRKAKLNMEDVLLGFGYSLKDSLNIPDNIMRMAKSRAGLADAKNQIIQTRKRYLASRLVAPFSGVIANLSVKEQNLSSTSDQVCTLLDNKELLVNFYILENEFGIVSKGDMVEVSPIALPNRKFRGRVKYINPIVNEHGLILVKAFINNDDEVLLDGMSVTLSVKRKIEKAIVVPKNALIDRQNKKVIFTYKNGKSIWNYVTTSYETKDSIIVVSGIRAGDKIIISGNKNLAHNTEVKLIE